MLIIIGLGNIGREYDNTLHNVGFMTLDKIADKLNIKLNEKGCSAEYKEYFYKSERIIFAKPQTYMNLSGKCARELRDKFNGKNEDIIVIYDDIDLNKGELRLREKGSAGTHNGMRNIIAELKSENIKRVRVGIGKAPEHMELKNYVLSKIKDSDFEEIEKGSKMAAQAILEYLENRDFQRIMQKYN